MKTHTDEPLSDGTRARNRKGSLSRKGVCRSGIGAAALSIVMLLSSCMSQDAPKATPVKNLSTGDAVIAVRLSTGTSVSGLQKPLSDNVIALVDAQGQVEAARIGEWNRGRVLWTDRGISYGTRDIDYLTTAEGAQEFAHQGFPFAEEGRFALPDGGIAVVTSPLSTGYAVDIIQPDGRVDRRETSGTEGYLGQCGDRILSIVDTDQLSRMKSEAFEAYAAQSGGDGEQPEELSVVIQLNDRDGDTPRIIGVAPMIDGLVSGQREFACEGDVITMPSVQTGDSRVVRVTADGGETGTMVLERWDLSTGQRTIIPVIDEQGNPIEVNRDRSIFGYEGIQVGDEYRFISEGGDAFAVDLRSGRGRYLFSYSGTRINQRMVYQVSETGVYALEGRREDHNVTLSYRPWDGGAYRDVITMDKLADYVWLEGGFMSSGHWRRIQSFSLRPGWDGGAQ